MSRVTRLHCTVIYCIASTCTSITSPGGFDVYTEHEILRSESCLTLLRNVGSEEMHQILDDNGGPSSINGGPSIQFMTTCIASVT